MLEAVQLAGEETLPCPKAGSSEPQNKNRPTPGFSENMKPFKEKTYFWHQIWQSAGSPIITEIHRIMKRSRNFYHVEFKKCKKAEDKVKKSKLLDACLNGNGELFKEIKLIRRMKPKQADTIDGVKEDILNHYKDIYSNLYNSVEDGPEVEEICDKIEGLIKPEHIEDVERVTMEEVKKAAAQLKPGKSDSTYFFSSDCIKVNSDLLAQNTATMIKSF